MYATKTLLVVLLLGTAFRVLSQSPNRFDVVITEIMADPSPAVGLPNAEYIELRNVSAATINLQGWRLSDESSTAIITTPALLPPDSVVILCANSQVTAFSLFGKAIGLAGFPALSNEGELLVLRSPQNEVVHAVAYASDWHSNEVKKEGGWSLEMVDPKNPCTGRSNWKSSTNALGGTPGKQNAVNDINTDDSPPQLLRTYTLDSLTLVAVFNEPLDSSHAVHLSNYGVAGLNITGAVPLGPLFQTVQITLSAPLQAGTVYHLAVNGVTDCRGNVIGAYGTAKAGLSQPPMAKDMVINEILFNPKPGAYDYVEFYNRSNKILDATTLYIANRGSSGTLAALKRLSEEPFPVFPGEYILVTEAAQNLKGQYLVKNEGAMRQLSSLPSFPDDKGVVALVSNSGEVIDEVAYEESWHFALIDHHEGVALERVNPTEASQKKDNWHSAAATVGYGTPTYQNSQHQTTETLKAMVAVTPKLFSPDNDGRDDVATVSYQVNEKGYLANVFIFDAGGRLVRQLVKNELLSPKGNWYWDGLGEKRNKLPIGTYVVFTEIFNLEGKKKSFKNALVLARPLE